MSFDAFSHSFKKEVTTKVSALERELGRGDAPTFEAYKERAGVIKGLKDALRIFQDSLRKHADIEDE